MILKYSMLTQNSCCTFQTFCKFCHLKKNFYFLVCLTKRHTFLPSLFSSCTFVHLHVLLQVFNEVFGVKVNQHLLYSSKTFIAHLADWHFTSPDFNIKNTTEITMTSWCCCCCFNMTPCYFLLSLYALRVTSDISNKYVEENHSLLFKNLYHL